MGKMEVEVKEVTIPEGEGLVVRFRDAIIVFPKGSNGWFMWKFDAFTEVNKAFQYYSKIEEDNGYFEREKESVST